MHTSKLYSLNKTLWDEDNPIKIKKQMKYKHQPHNQL